MDRQLLACSAVFVFALSIGFIAIPITAQQNAAPTNAGRQNRPNRSQPPAPRVGESKRPPPDQQAQAAQRQTEDVRGTEQSPAVVKVLPIPKTPEETAQEQADRQGQATTNRWVIGLTGALVLCTLGSIVVGVLQWLTYKATLAANKIVQRPYVSLSHAPPGIVPNAAEQAVHATVKVINSGNTPGDILHVDWILCTTIEEVRAFKNQEPPPRTAPIVATILPRDDFGIYKHASLGVPDFANVISGHLPLWVVGSVTYRDRLDKKRHRHFYGRRYIHMPLPDSSNNLVFMDEPHYNEEEDLD